MFHKYPSITNSHDKRFIDRMCAQHPELRTEVFSISSKLDGSNLSVCFDINTDPFIRVGSRNQLLGYDEIFQGVAIKTILCEPPFEDFLNDLSKEARTGHTVNLFGELASDGINKRVKYGSPVIRFFDIMIDGIMLSQYDFSNMCPLDLRVPHLGVVQNLDEALAFNQVHDSQILGIEGNTEEGIVIKPVLKVYYSHVGSIFYLKKKAPGFAEKENKPKKEHKELPSGIKELREAFMEYINESRVISTMSKEGEMESISQMSDYIHMIVNDAKQDFLNDHPEISPTPDVCKLVFNAAGGKVAALLKKRLEA